MPFRYCSINSINVDVAVEYIQPFFQISTVSLSILGHDANTLANLPRVNILVIGQSQNLTDTLMVCSYDPKTQEAGIKKL